MLDARMQAIWYFDDAVNRWLSRSLAPGRLVFRSNESKAAILSWAWEGGLISEAHIGTWKQADSQPMEVLRRLNTSAAFEAGRNWDERVRLSARRCLEEIQQLENTVDGSFSELCLSFVVRFPIDVGCEYNTFTFPIRSLTARLFADKLVAHLVALFDVSNDEGVRIVNERFAESGIGVEGERESEVADTSNYSYHQYSQLIFDALYEDSWAVTARHVYDMVVRKRSRREMFQVAEDLLD